MKVLLAWGLIRTILAAIEIIQLLVITIIKIIVIMIINNSNLYYGNHGKLEIEKRNTACLGKK